MDAVPIRGSPADKLMTIGFIPAKPMAWFGPANSDEWHVLYSRVTNDSPNAVNYTLTE